MYKSLRRINVLNPQLTNTSKRPNVCYTQCIQLYVVELYTFYLFRKPIKI